MQFLITWLAMVTLFVPSDSLLVQSVIDGGTIKVAAAGRVRLLGIEAPKLARGLAGPDVLAQKAKDFLEGLILHRFVRLEHDTGRGDTLRGSPVYVLTEDGQFVNAVIVREGFARVSARGVISRLDELNSAEQEARTLRKGMWAVMPPASLPRYTRPSKKKAGTAGTSTRRSTTGRTLAR
jgi:micrococcal nuclease